MSDSSPPQTVTLCGRARENAGVLHLALDLHFRNLDSMSSSKFLMNNCIVLLTDDYSVVCM